MPDLTLFDTLNIIKYVSFIPQHKKYDVEFLNACHSIIHDYAKAALDGKEIRNPYRDTEVEHAD